VLSYYLKTIYCVCGGAGLELNSLTPLVSVTRQFLVSLTSIWYYGTQWDQKLSV